LSFPSFVGKERSTPMSSNFSLLPDEGVGELAFIPTSTTTIGTSPSPGRGLAGVRPIQLLYLLLHHLQGSSSYPLGENNRTFRQLALLKRPDIGSTTSLIAEKEWDNTLINWAIQYAMVRYSSWLISILFRWGFEEANCKLQY